LNEHLIANHIDYCRGSIAAAVRGVAEKGIFTKAINRKTICYTSQFINKMSFRLPLYQLIDCHCR